MSYSPYTNHAPIPPHQQYQQQQQYPQHHPYAQHQLQQQHQQQAYSNNQNGQQQSMPSSRQSSSPSRTINKPDGSGAVIHAPVAAPPPDDMEPQNVSFIDSSQGQHNSSERGSQERDKRSPAPDNRSSYSNSNQNRGSVSGGGEADGSPTTERLKRMSIGSGSRTYRITGDGTSPTRPAVTKKTYRVPTKRGTPIHDDADLPQPMPQQRSLSPLYQPETDGTLSPTEPTVDLKTEPLVDGAKPDKGFYISFDGDAPVKPKPPLRTKKFVRKSSTPTTPVSTPSKEEEYPTVTVCR